MADLDPYLLRAFLTVAEVGTVNGAAGTLNRMQAEVSMRILKLEGLVGVALRSLDGGTEPDRGRPGADSPMREIITLNDEIGRRLKGKVVEGRDAWPSRPCGRPGRPSDGGRVGDGLDARGPGRIERPLLEAGTDQSRLLSAKVWLSDMNSFPKMNAVWDAWVTAGQTPGRTTVESRRKSLAHAVEIAVVASR